jgi:energy-coupling factor transporter ATP-binding protein EcfA2/SOS-response transcriptional repressor LexA
LVDSGAKRLADKENTVNLSPESERIIRSILSGKKVSIGKSAVGPYSSEVRSILQVLISQYEKLEGASGMPQADQLLAIWKDRGVTVCRENVDDGATDDKRQVVKREWKLESLRCSSIRGIAPYGEESEYPFEGKSNLIFGPNGSGKSSLLGAVIWVLTGKTITDATEFVEKATIHARAEGHEKGKKVCEWPTICTLPDDLKKCGSPECWAQVELRSSDNRQVFVRRSLSRGLETSEDGNEWKACGVLEAFGIGALDLQLSLLAPRLLSQNMVEEAHDVMGILSSMLGYDNLIAIGKLAADISGNITALVNNKATAISSGWAVLSTKLGTIVGNLADGDEKKGLARELSGQPDANTIRKVKESISSQIKTLNRTIQEDLKLQQCADGELERLGDQLVALVATLEKGFSSVFPELAKLDTEKVRPSEMKDNDVWLGGLEKSFTVFIGEAKRRIAARLEWWREESKKDSKARLLLTAAQYYEVTREECPVCEQSITGRPIEEQLKRLKEKDEELLREVGDFFQHLGAELENTVTILLRDELIKRPEKRLLADWEILKETAGVSLASVVNMFDERMTTVAASMKIDSTAIELFEQGAEDDFTQQGVEFVRSVQKANTVIANLKWSRESLRSTQEKLGELITAAGTENERSLLGLLEKGKAAARKSKPLGMIDTSLKEALKAREDIAASENDVKEAEAVKSCLSGVKELKQAADAEARRTLGEIGEAAAENWRKLYPGVPSGLQASRIVIERNKSLATMLCNGDHEVEGEHFANAGLQRAMALSLLGALVGRHPGGLGFVIFDDPFLSLDDEHREGWSDNILMQVIDGGTQVILATHQQQYLKNCGNAFRNDIIRKLNHRDEGRRISWQPGDLLERADTALQSEWSDVPNMLRRYSEQVLLTLQVYSPDVFFSPHNLTKSIERYRELPPSNPLVTQRQKQIGAGLEKNEVQRVLDPGSHAMTEADLTKPMVRVCFECLKKEVDGPFRREIEHFEILRASQRRSSVIESKTMAYGNIGGTSVMHGELTVEVLGRAAARPEGWEISEGIMPMAVRIQVGAVVFVSGESIDPVARHRQYVLLSPVETMPEEGDLVVTQTADGKRLLRRVSFTSDEVFLQAINPVKSIPPVKMPKDGAVLYKVAGVLYEAKGLRASAGDAGNEWEAVDGHDEKTFEHLKGILVEGDSMEPVARRGQIALVDKRETAQDTTLEPGGLAAIETADEAIGNAIKRVYQRDSEWILLSPNPVSPRNADFVGVDKIQGVWPLRGVVFAGSDGI